MERTMPDSEVISDPEDIESPESFPEVPKKAAREFNIEAAASFSSLGLSVEALQAFDRQVLSTARVGVAVYDPDLRYVVWNPFLEEMFGLRAEEVLGKRDSEILPFVKAEGLDALLEQALAGESTTRADFAYLIPKSGCAGWGSASYEPLRDAAGKIVGVLATVHDITQLKLTQQALHQSEERYRLVVETAADVIYMISLDYAFISLNQAFEKLTGWQRADWIGNSVLSLVHPDDLPRAASLFQQVLRGVSVPPFELRFVSRSGEYLVGECTAAAQLENGRVVFASGIIRDITARKHVEDALRRAEQKYRELEAQLSRLSTAVEHASESIVITDAAGTIEYVNPTFERTTGYSRDEAIGENSRLLKSENHDESFYRELWNTISRGEVWTGRFINKRKDEGLFEEEATISPVRDESGRIVSFVGVKRDVTKELDLEKRLWHSQKLEAVGRLASGVAHDFNNLLTAIIGYGQLIASRLESDHPLHAEVNEILNAGHRAAALTSQLLAFSRRQTLVPRYIDVNETIANLMKMLKRIIGENVDVSFEGSPDLSPVLADAGQIEQVIMNLAVNARDAMAGGGKLTIATRNVVFFAPYCREHPWARPGEYVQISVSDTGVGMDRETQRRMFEPFFTTKDIGKGTGLGLAVVYGIVKQHDGFIHVYSEPAQGTTFRVYLCAQDNSPHRQEYLEAARIQGGNETILVAEDEATLRELARTTLESLGYQVVLASNGEEAVLSYECEMDRIDLVILDLIMPRMGGREAYQRMIELGGDECPVIFMTGYGPETLRNDPAEARSAEMVQKPYGLYELGRKVRNLLDAHAQRLQN